MHFAFRSDSAVFAVIQKKLRILPTMVGTCGQEDNEDKEYERQAICWIYQEACKYDRKSHNTEDTKDEQSEKPGMYQTYKEETGRIIETDDRPMTQTTIIIIIIIITMSLP